MGDDPDPETEGEAPENSELTWACVSSDVGHYAFYADRDVTDLPTTVCMRLDRLELSAKAAWYITRALRDLRGKTAAIVGAVESDSGH
jgi:hypothetical protein